MCALKSLMSKVLSKTSVNVCRHQNVGAVFVGVVFFCQGSSAELLYQFDIFKVALNFLHGAFLKPCKKVNLTF